MDKLVFIAVRGLSFASLPVLLALLDAPDLGQASLLLFVIAVAQALDGGVFLNLQRDEPKKRRLSRATCSLLLFTSLFVTTLFSLVFEVKLNFLVFLLVFTCQISNILIFVSYSQGKLAQFCCFSIITQAARLALFAFLLNNVFSTSQNYVVLLIICTFLLPIFLLKSENYYSLLTSFANALYLFVERVMGFSSSEEEFIIFVIASSVLGAAPTVQSAFLHKSFAIDFTKTFATNIFIWIVLCVVTACYLYVLEISAFSIGYLIAAAICLINLFSTSISYRLANDRALNVLLFSTAATIAISLTVIFFYRANPFTSVLLASTNLVFLTFFMVQKKLWLKRN